MTDGVILIDKPFGISSFAAVSMVRRALGVKCGHCGTLDPVATGLLPIMCGKATKLSAYLTDGDKRYTASLKFGLETDTLDITGSVTATDARRIELDEILSVLPRFTGEIMQVPPAYSAIKVGGQRLYKLAREGKTVNPPARMITIYSIDVVSFEQNELVMDVSCSKGAYIRSLCRDIAHALGTVGTMSALRRTAACGWTVENAVFPDSERLSDSIIPIDSVLCDMPEYYPEQFFETLLSNGCAVDTKKLRGLPRETCKVYGKAGLIGIGKTADTADGTVFKLVTHL